MRMNLKKWALMAALALTPALAKAGTASTVNVDSVSFDTNLFYQVYNTAQQNNNQITEWPTTLANQAGIVLAAIRNTTATPIQPYFRVGIIETSYGCSNNEVLLTPLVIQLKDTLGPNESRTTNMNSWMLANSVVSAQFCSTIQNDLQSKFQNFDPSKIQEALNLLNQKNFQACLQQCDAVGSPVAGATKACATIKLFTANSVVNQTIVAMLIYPHNNEVPTTFPNFIWSPAILSSDIGKTDVWYTLEVSEQGQDAPFWTVDIDQPNAQFYQWKGSDRALTPGKSYCWKVISNIKIGDVKKPVGGNGKGWNITKCFTIKGDAPGRCSYTKEDLDKWLQANASADVKAQLQGQTIKNILDVENDPEICRLLSGQVKFTSIKVVKQ